MAMLPSEMPSDELDRRIGLLDKKISRRKRDLNERRKKYLKSLPVALAIIAFVCFVAYLIFHYEYLTEENTVAVTGRCVSVNTDRNRRHSWFVFEFENGNEYFSDSSHFNENTAELASGLAGKEVTVRITSESSTGIVELSDETQVYFSLDDTNRLNKRDFTIVFSIIGVVSAVCMLVQFSIYFPLYKTRDIVYWRKERDALLAEKESRNRQE